MDELARLLELDQLPHVADGAFPLLVPHSFVKRMKKGDPGDPLLLQVLPRPEELHEVEGYTTDPVGEVGKLGECTFLGKYQGRMLAITTGACAVNCRFCFRRHFPYAAFQPSPAEWRRALARLTPSTRELILSGGDPLVLPDRKLAGLFAQVEDTPVSTIRLHTRTPVVLPDRVNDDLLSLFAGSAKKIVLVMHINHANEVDDSVIKATERLKRCGVTLLNQSVLLEGVNACPEALTDLSWRLWDAGILPYYLHLLDKVAGAAHFDVEEEKAVRIMSALTARLPGYLVPRLVREVPGKPSKTPVQALAEGKRGNADC